MITETWKELEIYIMSDEVGPGLPLWLPNGAVMVEGVKSSRREVEFGGGYSRVRTPHITKEAFIINPGICLITQNQCFRR